MRHASDQVTKELRRRLRAIYLDRLKGCFVFGSYARGEADDESDLDVLIVLDRVTHYSDEVDRTSQITGELSLGYGVSISRVFLSEDDWLHADNIFLQNVRQDAISV